MSEARRNVLSAISVLDEKRPGWENEIDLDRLDVADPKHCILGQLYGGFAKGLLKLKVVDLGNIANGFAGDKTDIWLEEINKRRELALA